MPTSRPYHRTCRAFTDGSYAYSGNSRYILHGRFASSPEHYVRAFNLILKDLINIFDFIEPSDTNLECYSFRLQELLFRCCVEIEANFKAILIENGFNKSKTNINDYNKVNITHHLSSYEVKIPVWTGDTNIRKPFAAWESFGKLSWYDAYNSTKHSRLSGFKNANLNNLMDAVCGLLVVLSSQFLNNSFSSREPVLIVGAINDGFSSAIGEYFRIKYPTDWSNSEQYDFNWDEIKHEEEPFAQIDYSRIIIPERR